MDRWAEESSRHSWISTGILSCTVAEPIKELLLSR